MCTSTSSQNARKRDPVCQESEGHYAPPHFIEGCRALEQEAIEHQEGYLNNPKDQIQETVVDGAQLLIVFVEP